MKPKTLILMLVAIGCGLAAAILVRNLNAKSVQEMDMVLVAAADLPPGTKIDSVQTVQTLFAPKESPKGTAQLLGAFSDTDADKSLMVGKRLSLALPKGEVLTKKHLEDTSLMSRIPEGYRAMSVPVRIDTVVAGFIVPGARVDLMTVYQREQGGQVAQVFMQDVLVLAINTETAKPQGAPDQTGTTAMPNPTTATLAVKPEDGIRIELAKAVGRQITMTLRGLGDTKKIDDKSRLITNTLTGGKGDLTEEAEKVLVAKRDIEKDEKLVNLKELFEEKEVPWKPDEAIYVRSFSDKLLADSQKILAPMKKGTPVARGFLGTEEAKSTNNVPPPPTHKLKIINGNQPPTETEFFLADGRSVRPAARETTPAPSPAPGPDTAPKSPGSEGK